ncbi:hypothetical protein MBLNU230_g4750t1 [Neophaeotheca triangularis]
MSRMSIRTYLSAAKKQLRSALHNQTPASLVVGNESADLDSITSALLYGYIQSSSLHRHGKNAFVIPITNIPAADLALRPELAALLKHAYIEPGELITLDDLDQDKLLPENSTWTLVDHNAFQGALGARYSTRVEACIDHHADESKVPASASPRLITTAGSCSSLVANHVRETWESLNSSSTAIWAAHGQNDRLVDDVAYTSTWDAQAAKLALGSILIDTANLKDENKTTDHDRKAVRYLEAKIFTSGKLGATFDRDAFFAEINEAKGNMDGLSLEDVLRKDYKLWTEGDQSVGVASVVKPMKWLVAKSDSFLGALQDFQKKRDLTFFAIMTAFTDETAGFAREILLLAADNDRGRTAVKAFETKFGKELQLVEKDIGVSPASASGADGSSLLRCWDQNNLAASRKQVGPMLREALREA